MAAEQPRWKPVTQVQNAGVMTRYLAHVAALGIDDLTIDGVVDWVTHLEPELSPHTIAGYVKALWRVGRVVGDEDLQWLYDAYDAIEREAEATPRRKDGRIVHSEHILQFAFEAIAQAREAGPSSWRATQRYRDALLLALATVAPERRRGLTGIRLIDLDMMACTVTFPSSMTKDGRARVRSYPPVIRDLLIEWIEAWRSRWVTQPDHGHLWIAKGGQSAGADALYIAMVKLTAMGPWGHSISPHRLRDSAATTLTDDSPEIARLAQLVLGHARETTTDAYRRDAECLQASRVGRRHIASARAEIDKAARASPSGNSTTLLHPRARGRRLRRRRAA
jgi:site-specific recombinase XerC